VCGSFCGVEKNQNSNNFKNLPFFISMAAAAKFVLPIPILLAYLVPLDVEVTGNITAKICEVWSEFLFDDRSMYLVVHKGTVASCWVYFEGTNHIVGGLQQNHMGNFFFRTSCVTERKNNTNQNCHCKAIADVTPPHQHAKSFHTLR
jgi:hypothetical protein